MDDVFKAISDPSRRLLMDRLKARDGQTLTELCEHLPDMTRFGVMSHLKILEEAGLVASRKVGRNKHHYLNPMPIQKIHTRWISKYTATVVERVAAVEVRAEKRKP
ncbi:MAG: ArsR/SmtB family transcription factor [Acidimicrobiales bacterium]